MKLSLAARVSKYLHEFVSSYGQAAPEAALWVAVIKFAASDLTYKRKEVREDAESFLFGEDDDRLVNLLNILGLDGDLGKCIVRKMIE